jgi:hypothetical protein
MKTASIKSFIGVLLFGLLFTSGQAVSAQETKKSPEEKAKVLTERMKEKLTLIDDQSSKVYEINLKYIKKNEQLQNSSGGRPSKLKTLKANQEAKDKELKSVLSSEQYEAYQQLKEQLMEELKENRRNKK